MKAAESSGRCRLSSLSRLQSLCADPLLLLVCCRICAAQAAFQIRPSPITTSVQRPQPASVRTTQAGGRAQMRIIWLQSSSSRTGGPARRCDLLLQ
jgi:hypothetical protein